MGDVASTSVRKIAAALLPDVDQLAAELATMITSKIDLYADEKLISRAEIIASFKDNLAHALRQLSGERDMLDLAVAAQTGSTRAGQGVPLPELLRVYRLGHVFLWERLLDGARKADPPATEELLDVAADVLMLTDEYALAVTEGYRRTTTERALADDRRRSGLLAALLDDGGPRTSAWELARLLALPYEGVFLVVVAEAVERDTYPLPGISGVLERLRVGSVWRSRPDFEIGVLSIGTSDKAASVVSAIGEIVIGRAGFSPEFRRIDGAARALRLARVAMESLPLGSSEVRQFVDEPHTDLLIRDFEETRRHVDRVLGPVLAMTDDDRAVLLETAHVWVRVHGSVAAAARELYCHENTVRHRLHRLENRLGSSLSDPTAIAQVATALEAIRIFPGLVGHGPG